MGIVYDTSGSGGSWPVEVTVSRSVTLVTYPSFPCTAEWVYTDAVAGGFHAQEILTKGLGTCLDGFFIEVVKYGPDQLYTRWMSPSGIEYQHATLSRR